MKDHLRNQTARDGLTFLHRLRERFLAYKDKIPLHREGEAEACLAMIESVSDAILDDDDISDEMAMQKLAIPEMFLLSLEEAADEEEE